MGESVLGLKDLLGMEFQHVLYIHYIYTHNFNIGVITCYTKIILIYNISL